MNLHLLAVSLVAVSSAASAAPELPHVRCGTAQKLPEIRSTLQRLGIRPQPVYSGSRGGFGGAPAPLDNPARQLRDGYNVQTATAPASSTHFALRWGPDRTVSPETAQAILDGLEYAWDIEIDQYGYPAPFGTDTYFLNAYVGNSGGNAPDIDFVGAYVTSDPQGYPIITIHPSLFQEIDAAQQVAAHEFFHTIQFSTGSYDRFASDRSAWYWEATAEWMSSNVYPGGGATEDKVGAYLIAPQFSVFGFAYLSQGSLLEYRPYGATLFPRYLTEFVTDDSIIRDSWLRPTGDVIETLAALLQERGTTIEDAFAGFAGHAAVLDFKRGKQYGANAMQYGWYFQSEDATVIGTVEGLGTTKAVTPPVDTLPQAFGYNTIKMSDPLAGSYTFRVHGDANGSEGSQAAYRGYVVEHYSNGKNTYHAIAWTGVDGEVTVAGVDKAELYLVVSATPEYSEPDESFGYTYEAKWEPPAPPPLPTAVSVDDPKYSGCSMTERATPIGAPLFIVTLALASVAARRRRLWG